MIYHRAEGLQFDAVILSMHSNTERKEHRVSSAAAIETKWKSCVLYVKAEFMLRL